MKSSNKLADIEFRLEWKSPFAAHTDIYYAIKVDTSYDKFPTGFAEQVADLGLDESYQETFQAKDLLGEGYSSDKVKIFTSDLFDTYFKNQYSPPMLYRFYPSAIACIGLDTTESDYSPFRLISMNKDNMGGDCNPPLAKYYLTLIATKVKQFDDPVNNDRAAKNIGRMVTSKGPGMQAPFEFGDAIFFDRYPFRKVESEIDSKNWVIPSIDTQASDQIAKLYSELLPRHSKVLDVMSKSSSYLETDYETGLLTGLGINEEELSANKRLDTYEVQDLNSDINFSFEENSFDDAICSLSIEYLTDPLGVMKEVARVVNSGGKFIISFSNNYLPNQTHTLWAQLHPFERMQLVLECFRKSGLFTELNTFSKRGMPRIHDDKNSSEKSLSDPVFAVWGTVK